MWVTVLGGETCECYISLVRDNKVDKLVAVSPQ